MDCPAKRRYGADCLMGAGKPEGGISGSLLRPAAMLALGLSAAAGLVVSILLWRLHVDPDAGASALFRACSAGVFDCEHSVRGGFSTVLGAPLAAWGAALYASALVFLALRTAIRGEFAEMLDTALVWAGAISVLTVIPLALISAFALRAFCLFCVLSWACNAGVFVSSLYQAAGPGKRPIEALRISFGGTIRYLAGFSRYYRSMLAIAAVPAVAIGAVYAITAVAMPDGARAAGPVRERILERSLEEFRRTQPTAIDLAGAPVYCGSADARVVVVEFFNFDCVICREASTVVASIIDRYPGRVRLHLLHYPADARCNRNVSAAGDALSCRASLIAIALQNTNYYRAFVASLLKTRLPLSRQLVRNALTGVGMDTERLKGIMDERDAEKALVMQIIEAEHAGIAETPSFVINGRALRSGLPPEWLLDALIREEIRRVYGD